MERVGQSIMGDGIQESNMDRQGVSLLGLRELSHNVNRLGGRPASSEAKLGGTKPRLDKWKETIP